MWIHIVIFVVIAGIVLGWKTGWLQLDGLADRESVRLFLLVAVCGNLLGTALTLTGGGREVYTEGYRLEKENSGAYTEEFQVSVDGEDPEKVQVQVPEKDLDRIADEVVRLGCNAAGELPSIPAIKRDGLMTILRMAF